MHLTALTQIGRYRMKSSKKKMFYNPHWNLILIAIWMPTLPAHRIWKTIMLTNLLKLEPATLYVLATAQLFELVSTTSPYFYKRTIQD